ncbi:MAG: DotA/TraY family protein [Lentisphaerae bacterium]|nr:DotA/TraY family protein [Lentisphaerota bacterium]
MNDYNNQLSSGDFFVGNLSTTDSIVSLLAPIFGNDWATIGIDSFLGGGGGGGSDSASMIIAVLGALNIVALNAGALMLGWVAFQATVGTAHEGQFMGKRFHDYWVPLRSGLMIAFMAPVTKGGLCLIQTIGLIMIGFSIQFANFIQNAGLDYMVKNSGRVVAVTVPPAMHENAANLAEGLLKTLVIQYHYMLNQKKNFEHYTVENSPQYTFKFHGPNMVFNRLQVLSYVQIPQYDTSSNIAIARAEAVQKMYHTLSDLAYSIVINTTAEFEDVPFDIELYQKSINEYIASVAPHIGELLSDQNPDFQSELENFVNKAKTGGVVWLGAYYQTISRYAGKVHDIAADYPSFSPVDLSEISDDMNILLESALSSVQNIKKDMDNRIEIARQNSGSNIFKGYLNKITYSLTSMPMNAFVESVIDGDPMANLADWGHTLILTGETIIVAYLGFFAAAEFANGAADSIIGKVMGVFTAGTTDGAANAALGVLSKLWTIVLFTTIPLITLGVMLAAYFPAVPFVIWMSAIIGCVVLWLEFLVFMPIWSITFAIGEGEGITGNRSEQGIMFIANAILRLPLMVVGFMIAVVLMPLIGKLIGLTFMVFTGGMTADHTVGIAIMIATWFLFGGFTILQSHVIFGLVTHLPDNAMKFFGGAVSSMGEDGHEGKTRAMIMASLNKGENAGQALTTTKAPEPGNLGGKKQDQNTLSGEGKTLQDKGGDSLTLGERS